MKPRIRGPLRSPITSLPAIKRFQYMLDDGRTRMIDCTNYKVLAWAIENKQEGIAWP